MGFSVNIDGEVTAATNDAEAVVEQAKELSDFLSLQRADLAKHKVKGLQKLQPAAAARRDF